MMIEIPTDKPKTRKHRRRRVTRNVKPVHPADPAPPSPFVRDERQYEAFVALEMGSPIRPKRTLTK
jgi:hypothetical protein